MEDIEILKQVLAQEIKAEMRYSLEIGELFEQEVKDVLEKLRVEEESHILQTAEKIKEIDPNFEFEFKKEKIEDNKSKADTVESLKSVLVISIEKEKIAAQNYDKFSKELKDPALQAMVLAFKKDELQHKDTITDILAKIEVLEEM